MKIEQELQLKKIDEIYGVGDEIKEKLHRLDQKGEIKPHFSIKPVLYMIIDRVELNNENYNEYKEEYL